MKINVETTDNSLLLVPAETELALEDVKNDWFNPDYWASHQRLVGESSGRNTTWFIRPNGDAKTKPLESSDWVLRHYYRGGMVAKVSRDKFLFTGVRRTRPYKELKLLMEMQRLGLPVPRGVAARVVKQGLNYSADLLMQRLDADDMVKWLSRGKLTMAHWNNVGDTIARFHRRGVYHADLNAHNIMIDQKQKVWLIDFDRCHIKKPSSDWQQQNINRLRRSFVKEKGLNPLLNFDDQCWQWLTESYSQALI